MHFWVKESEQLWKPINKLYPVESQYQFHTENNTVNEKSTQSNHNAAISADMKWIAVLSFKKNAIILVEE